MAVMQASVSDALRPAGAEQLIGALVPPPTRKRMAAGTPTLVPPLPAHRLPLAENSQSFCLDVGRPDASGRLSARHLLRALEWSPGDRIEHGVIGDAIVVARSATGRSQVGPRGDLMIPASVRALAGIDGSCRVVLVAAPAQDTLVIHAQRHVAELIAAYYASLDLADDS
jgi:bifunctional DNA-binding transcriptional regulator/antitoxin component of YhaV-PrlF toxin-antitoxin module